MSASGVEIPFNQCNGSVTIGEGGEAIGAVVMQPRCRGDENGSINITVNAGSAPYEFAWTKDGTAFGTAEDLNNLAPGTYIVVVTDNAGATFNRQFIINNPAGVMITNANIVEATDGANGSISLTVSGGATPLRYSWSTGATTRDVTGLAGGTYELTITDANGCTLDTTFILGGGELAVTLQARDYNGVGVSCFGEADGELTARASGGSPPYTYAWSVAGQTGATVSDLAPGMYSVTVTDAAGDRAMADITVVGPERLSATISTTPSPNNIEGTANATVQGGSAPYTYRWNDPGRTTTRVVINLPAGTYTVLVSDANGCEAQGTGIVPSGNKQCFTGLSVITPNGDGKNDALLIECVAGLENELEIYNRQGQLVFTAVNYDNTWQGVNQTGSALPDGAYYFVVRVRRDGILEQHLGHFTLLRTLF